MKRKKFFSRKQIPILILGMVVLLAGYKLFSDPVYLIDRDVNIDKIVISDEDNMYTAESSVLKQMIIIEDSDTMDRLVSELREYDLKRHKADAVDSLMSLTVEFYSQEDSVVEIKLVNGSRYPICQIYNKVPGQVYFWLPGSFIETLYEVIEEYNE